jgi:hypothetical protein
MTSLAVALCCALAACAGGGSAAPSAGGGLSYSACDAHPLLATGTLTSPSPGATNVSTSTATVAVAYDAQLVGAAVQLQPNGSSAPNGGGVTGGTFAPAVTGPNLVASIPPLAPGTTYFVKAATTLSNGSCTQSVAWTFGTFTTQ